MEAFGNMSKKQRIYMSFVVMILFMIVLLPFVTLCESYLLEIQSKAADVY